MTDVTPAPNATDVFLRHRRWFEIGFWVFAVVLSAIGDTVTVGMELTRAGLPHHPLEPAVWEWSSHLAMLALVPAIMLFTRRFPLHLDTWRRQVPWYLLASVLYSLAHVLAMVAMRKAIYAAAGSAYDFGDWPRQLTYEYIKDVRTFFNAVLLIHGYRFLVLRLQGEASLLAAPDDDAAPVEPVDRPERFLVRKLGREFLVAATDIESLQASGNYVNLRVRGRDYPLRSTIAAIESRLDPARFQRVHRSWIVNLDHMAMIEPLDTGDARLHLKDGTTLPCSRRYRPALRERAN